MGEGEYYHFGVAKKIIENGHLFRSAGEELKLVFGVDQLPVSNSSISKFWPILFYIRPYSEAIFTAGLYWGYVKPCDSNDFVVKLHRELTDLRNYGCLMQNTHYDVQIDVI